MLEANILSLITFLPVVGALVLLAIPENSSNQGLFRWGSFGISVVTFLLSLLIPFKFLAGEGLQFVIRLPWIPALHSEYFMALDGVSLWLVLLNTFLFPLAILSSIGVISKKEKMYYFLLLLLEGAITGVFLAQDLLLFFFFWEAVLIPMYFLIGIWGGKNRLYATTKFVLYTMVGSMLMLAALIATYLYSGGFSAVSGATLAIPQLAGLPMPEQVKLWCFLAFFLAFAIKVPLFPFHTWLPDAHTEAPTAGSIILAGVLLKMGTYGFIRVAMPLFPEALFHQFSIGPVSFTLRDLVMALSVIGIIYGALVAAVQTDVKRLVAYSSIAHLGFVMLGLFAMTQQAVDGAILQMVAHGISTGGLFMLVGFIYERRHTRAIVDFGGLAAVMPVYYNIFLIIMLSSVGLPALNGFVGEFLILLGSWKANWLMTVLATSGVILAAVYLLYMFRRVFFGEVTHEENKGLKDLGRLELASIMPLVLMAFFMGIFPTVFLARITPDSTPVVERLQELESNSLPPDSSAVKILPGPEGAADGALLAIESSGGAL
ncbi:NADH-quinone oxidoreductase subunit M [bacterium]|nr:NADH-quinone oxidoreductase subunit M [bacterium]